MVLRSWSKAEHRVRGGVWSGFLGEDGSPHPGERRNWALLEGPVKQADSCGWLPRLQDLRNEDIWLVSQG